MQCHNKLTTCYMCPDDNLAHRLTQLLDFLSHPVFRIQKLDIFLIHVHPSSDKVWMSKKLSDSKLVVCVLREKPCCTTIQNNWQNYCCEYIIGNWKFDRIVIRALWCAGKSALFVSAVWIRDVGQIWVLLWLWLVLLVTVSSALLASADYGPWPWWRNVFVRWDTLKQTLF
jgi:hypothetical protein